MRIDWPNGGWLDESHFTPVDITDGMASFTSDRGYEYQIEITDAPLDYSGGDEIDELDSEEEIIQQDLEDDDELEQQDESDDY